MLSPATSMLAYSTRLIRYDHPSAALAVTNHLPYDYFSEVDAANL